MATYRAVSAVLQALKDRLDLRMKALLGGQPKAIILGSTELMKALQAEHLGIYLHCIAVGPFARNRHLEPQANQRAPQPELPVNLHTLLIGWSELREVKINLLKSS